MQYRKLGKINFEVSALGFGAMRLPGMKNPLDPRVDEKEAIRMIRHAIDSGINYLDTAWPYHMGASERIVGKALQDGYREKVFLVTKLPMFLVNKKDDFNRYLDSQLERLQTDYLDCYLFHAMSAGALDKLEKFSFIEDMEREKTAGRIKNIGFSFHDTLPVFKKIVDYYDWDLAQIQYNYLDTAVQAGHEGLLYAAQKGIAITIMEPLKGGMLANPPGEARQVLDASSVKHTPVDWALQYLWNLPEVSVVLSGMSTMEQLEQNILSAENSGIDSLSVEENNTIDKIITIYQKRILVPCTACKYCMPCPAGVNIPANFAAVNTANTKPVTFMDRVMKARNKRVYRKMDKSRDKVDKKNPNGNASLCIECGKCIPLCPQGIDIPTELAKVHQVMGKRKKPEDVF
ncbi:MAG: aldo/keto reductase [Spirochaetales bacterium]|uniref:Aldo/keto reductase n=1 Tax=Candidatus Thalassospirochaeta sargassi TaxID=3119039 RepID=A0AAJ1IF20_9SPIO|nr:aldo/keto reductase [Spirochaetales bacterium]